MGAAAQAVDGTSSNLVIDKDGWPVIVDGIPGPWPDGLSGEHRRHLEDLEDE